MELGPVAISLLGVGILNLAIGGYVFLRKPKGDSTFAFALMATTTGIWAIVVAMSRYGPFYLEGARLSMAIGGLIPLTSVLFVSRFSPSKHGQRALALFTPVSLLLSALSLTPLVVVSLERHDGSSRITQGPLYLAFALHVLLCFSYAVGLLYSRYRSSDEPQRSHLKRLLWALGIPIAVGTTTNLVLPLFFQIYALGKYGPCFTIVMIGVVAHAIIRHRLMDVRVVVKQGAVYLAAFLVAGGMLLGLLVLSNIIGADEQQVSLREVWLALLVALLFHPLKDRIQRAFDRYLYRQPYDYKQTISHASRALSTTIALPALLERLGNVVDSALRPEGYSIYLLDEEDEEYGRVFIAGSIGWPDRLPVNTVLLTSTAREGKPVFRDEIGAGEPVLAEMRRLGSEIVIALLAESRVFGLLAIGPKRSGDPYYSDDADLLTTLANQSAVAIRNAQTHQQVLEANEYIQKILATIESGVISVSARGRIRLFNRAAEVMTGSPADGLRGQPIGHLRGPLARLIEDTLADGQSRSQVELALPDAAGQIVPLMCSTAPLRSSDDTLTGAVAVVSDLSRLKELEQEKQRVERLAALESIASGLVHEIRNPLVAIKTFTQLLPSRAGDASFGQDVARVTEREVSRIEDLLGRLRTLAAPPSRPLVEVDVAEPLHATIELLRGQMEQRQIRLRYVADGPTRPVLGDASQLEQLFLNVCLNALEAMETGGELTIRLADLCAAGGTTLLVEVCDTGTGIPEDLLPTIFNPFVTTKARGSGLGLAICRSIADAHRATLVARNNVGRPGSTFTLEFPVIVASSASTYA